MTKHDITDNKWYHNTNYDIIVWYHIHVISYVISSVILYVTWGNTVLFSCALSGGHLPAVFLCLLRPGPCLAHSLLPDSLRPLDRYRQGLAPSVAPQPEIHLVESAAIAAILLGISGRCTKESAVLEFWRESMGVDDIIYDDIILGYHIWWYDINMSCMISHMTSY